MVLKKTNANNKSTEYGIALSGGGLLSVAQLSILGVIEPKIGKPAFYAGTSGGSIIAGLLAAGVSSSDIL